MVVLVAQNVELAPAAQSVGGVSHVQAAVPFGPVQLWCVGHDVVEATYGQLSESSAQCEIERAPAHSVSLPVAQLGSTLHVQLAEPAAPVQLWRWPQATAAAVA